MRPTTPSGVITVRLGDFKLLESSEQGMLAEVERANREKRPIVFLAWEPHPMNKRFALRYLTGGDSARRRSLASRSFSFSARTCTKST